MELSGTPDWHETAVEFTGIVVVSPIEFQQAIDRVASGSADPALDAAHPRRAPGRARKPR
jgi:hypothetical protein